MSEELKLPRKLSDEPKAPKPRRPSHQKVIENLEPRPAAAEIGGIENGLRFSPEPDPRR